MKKNTMIGEEHAKAWEAEIRKNEREKYAKQINAVADLIIKASHALSELGMDTWNPGLRQLAEKRERDRTKLNGKAATPAKRKPTVATQVQREAVFDTLGTICEEFPERSVTPKELRGATRLGPKVIGAALRELKKDGAVVEVSAGKYRVDPSALEVDPPPPAAA